MEKKEFAEIMAMLSAAIDKPIGKTTLSAWYAVVKDLPTEAVAAAVHTIIATDQYPTLPSIGKIRQTAIDLMQGPRITAGEAYQEAIKAIRKYGRHGEKEGMASLSEAAARTVKMMGWQDMCMANNNEVLRGQFMRVHEAQEARTQEQVMIPPQARAILERGDWPRQIEDGKGAEQE